MIVTLLFLAGSWLKDLAPVSKESVTIKNMDSHPGSLRDQVKHSIHKTVAIATCKDHYPYGQLLYGRNYNIFKRIINNMVSVENASFQDFIIFHCW